MKNLEKLLKGDALVLFKVEDEDKVKFLSFAKSLGCKWISQKTISETTDTCSSLMAIDKFSNLGIVSPMCWIKMPTNIRKIAFNSEVKNAFNL